VALTTEITAPASQLKTEYYLMGKSVKPTLLSVASARGAGTITLFDANGRALIVDRFALSYERGLAHYDASLIASFVEYRDGPSRTSLGRTYDPLANATECALFLITPVFIADSMETIFHKPILTITRDFTLTLDEIKSIDEVECEIQF
jgi:hypothetical protein